MKQSGLPESGGSIPEDSVLLIPDPEADAAPAYGIRPGYYTTSQLLALVKEQRSNADAIQFIADMLETGDPESDEFANLLKKHQSNPAELATLVELYPE